MSGGYIPISRALFDSDNEFWSEKREYSRFEAWVDLIQMAQFEETSVRVLTYEKVTLQRGQLIASVSYLSKRWSWGDKKARLFINHLENENMIKRVGHKGKVTTIITLCNYDKYNPVSSKKGKQKGEVGAKQGRSRGDNIIKNKERINKEIKNKGDFEVFRKSYPGRKDGLDTEFERLCKYKDWEDVIPSLLPALQSEIEWRNQSHKTGQFVPSWANLKTWINQRRWEQELPGVEKQQDNASHVFID